MRVETYFLRYAFPCAYVCLERREITQAEFEELEKAALTDDGIAREILEKVFFRAFEKIRKFAHGKDVWDKELIRAYFHNQHNKDLDAGKSSLAPHLFEFCKIHKAKVLDKKDNVLSVEYNGNKRNVLNDFVPDVSVGDSVFIHHGYAVEKV